MDDHDYMDMALDLALKGQGFTSPNPMVGAVVVKNGKVIGSGYHQAAGKPHAEVNALNDAGGDANGATLYVNLEPCNHTGRTPPCTDKILNSGVQRVVVAMQDPNTDVKGGGIDFLKKNGIDISLGICEARAERLNEIFVKYIRTKRPFVILKCAATLDGRIATRTGDSKWITNEQSRGVVHQVRHAVDAILVGINTVNADDPSLTTRLPHGRGKDAVRVVLDTNLSISPDAKVLRLNSDSDTILVARRSAIEEKKSALTANGVRLIESVLKNKRIDMDLLMDQLGALGITSLLIEGGSHVIASALNTGVVDKIMLFYAPKLTGGDDGVPICRGKGPDLMADCIAVKDVTLQRFGDDVMIEGYIENA
jgi:diaminohydroxyphosphoribosylaminopyrimidine deaminase/5-amino-6-(5-phosphoribosylamino)uracil reductase